MSAPIIAVFNSQGDVGKTTLVYHLAWLYSDLGTRVLAVDLDPQARLTEMFLDEDQLEELWNAGRSRHTVLGAIQPALSGGRNREEPQMQEIADRLALVAGDPALAAVEDQFADAWARCPNGDPRAFQVLSAFHQVLLQAAGAFRAGVVLLDTGSNLGALNRAILLAADHVVVPLSPDLLALQALRAFGPLLRQWQQEWSKHRQAPPGGDGRGLPLGQIEMAGYIVRELPLRMDRPVTNYGQWLREIPKAYWTSALGEKDPPEQLSLANDPECLAIFKSYPALLPLAQEARKPMFHLKPADGALGALLQATGRTYGEFSTLAHRLADATGVRIPLLSEPAG